MPYGLKDIELQKLCKVFESNERIERVVLYGSRAKGNYKPFSDVDMTLMGEELTHTDLNHLSLAIDDLLLPYQFDISIFHTLKNEALIDHIHRVGITIYERESEWKEYKLGEIASFVKEKVAVQSIATENYISTENMLPNKGGITVASGKPEGGTVTKYYPNTILVSNIRPYFKKIWYANNEGGCSNDVLCFEAKKGVVDSKYLFFLLSQDMFFDYVMLGSKGCKMPRGDKAHIMNWDISLPSLDEQRRIASILTSLDDKIDLLRRENATLEVMAETLFRQWFVVEAKEEWEEIGFGEAIDVYDSRRKPLSKMERDKMKNGNTLYPYYGAAEIMDYIDSYLFDGEYILMGEDGTVKTDDGYPILQYATEKFWPNNHAHVLQAKLPYNNCFVWNYLRTTNIESIVTGAVQPKINQANLLSLPFYKYPIELVSKYIMITRDWWTKKLNNNKQIQTLIQTRDGLLPRLMGGEIRV